MPCYLDVDWLDANLQPMDNLILRAPPVALKDLVELTPQPAVGSRIVGFEGICHRTIYSYTITTKAYWLSTQAALVVLTVGDHRSVTNYVFYFHRSGLEWERVTKDHPVIKDRLLACQVVEALAS